MNKFTLDRNDSLLMIIDIQERLVPVMKKGEKIIDKTNILISAAKELELPIITTEQYPKGLGPTVSQLKSNINSDNIFEKVTFTAYTEQVSSMLESLNRKKIIITGMETHICVFQTVRDLLAKGYEVFLVSDAVCSRSKDNYKNGLRLIESMGAMITNTETVIFDLLKEAGTPEFKTLSKLIK